MKTVAFFKSQDCYVLRVRSTCQIALAKAYFLEKGYGISFHKIPYWYQCFLPVNLPYILVYLLKKRAEVIEPRTTAAEF